MYSKKSYEGIVVVRIDVRVDEWNDRAVYARSKDRGSGDID